MAALVFGGFAITSVVLHLLIKQTVPETYKPSKDPWIYMWVILAAGLGAVYTFMPAYADFVSPFSGWNIALWCGLSLLIYISYLFESDKLTLAVVVVSALAVSLLIPNDFSVFRGLLPFWLDRLAVVMVICLFTYACGLLNGMAGVYGLQMVGIGLGVFVISFLGGVPLMLGFMGAFAAGVWLGYLQLNWYPADVEISDGACMSGGFLAAGLMLQGTIEYAGPSMLVLSMYIWAELIFTVINRWLFRRRDVEIYQNTAYYAIFTQGIELSAISFGIIKILIINFILALFQLRISNPLSMPVFAAAADLWLLNVMYRASSGFMTFREANQEFIKNVKEGLAGLKQSEKKDKE